MTEKLDPKPTDKVLEIGTGSGYQAAVLSELVSDVCTIEQGDQVERRAILPVRFVPMTGGKGTTMTEPSKN